MSNNVTFTRDGADEQIKVINNFIEPYKKIIDECRSWRETMPKINKSINFEWSYEYRDVANFYKTLSNFLKSKADTITVNYDYVLYTNLLKNNSKPDFDEQVEKYKNTYRKALLKAKRENRFLILLGAVIVFGFGCIFLNS